MPCYALCWLLDKLDVWLFGCCRHHVCLTSITLLIAFAFYFRSELSLATQAQNNSGLVHNGRTVRSYPHPKTFVQFICFHDTSPSSGEHCTELDRGECKPFVYAQKRLKHIDVGIVVNVVSVFGCVTQIFPKKFSVCEAPPNSVKIHQRNIRFDFIVGIQIMHPKRGCSMWRYPSLMR